MLIEFEDIFWDKKLICLKLWRRKGVVPKKALIPKKKTKAAGHPHSA